MLTNKLASMVGEKIGTTNALDAAIRTNNHFRFDHTYLGISDFVTSALSQVQLVALDSRRCSITENDWRECVISAMETLRNSSNSPSRNLYDSPSRNTRNSPSRNSHKSPSHNSRKSPTLYPNCPCDHCLRQGECTDESSVRVVNGSNSGDHDLDDCKHKLEKIHSSALAGHVLCLSESEPEDDLGIRRGSFYRRWKAASTLSRWTVRRKGKRSRSSIKCCRTLA